MSVNGLVLGGGGARGAYQIGVLMALNELGYKYNVVTGTSVGALNAFLLGMNNFDLLKEIWVNIDFEQVIEHKYKFKNKANETFIKGLLKGGLKVTPLRELVNQHIDVKKLKNSDIKTGIVYTSPIRKYTPVIISEAPDDMIHEYLITSCSAIPFLKKNKINNKKCYDGYYSDNLPVKLAMEMGATKIIAIDIMKGVRKKVDTSNIDYLYIKPSVKLGFFLDFDNKAVNKMIDLGYQDVMNHKERILEFINK